MKRTATMILGMLLLTAWTTAASAAFRSPQVPVAGGSLQGYLNSVGESINVLTDQNAAQRWASTVSNNSTFTIQVELSGAAPNNNIGLYNASGPPAPALYQLFPGAAAAGWFAVASFRNSPTRVVVNLFDDNAVSQGANTYLGADRNDFGFYLDGPGGLFYSQDARNAGGDPQALTFAGTGQNSGSWWLCWEDRPYSGGSDHDFDDCVLFMESVNPTPVNKTTWGQLKARFR